MDRRTFMKLGGAVAAAGMTGACGQAAQKIIPYAIPPNDGVNPVEGWFYSTTCRMCDAGCGIMVRTVEGRAKKVEGNPDHPINRGGVCARGQAAVQQYYHPERLKTALKRTGAKGNNSFTPIPIDEALNLLAERMKTARGKGSFVIASDANDVTSAIAWKILGVLGSTDFAVPALNGREKHVRSMAFAKGLGTLPYYDISQLGFLLLLGADILESGFSPVHYAGAYGEMRRGNPVRRGRMVYVGRRMSMTAASADRFIAANPGSLGFLSMGLSHEVFRIAGDNGLLKKIPVSLKEKWKSALGDYTPQMVMEKTAVPAKVITGLARELLEQMPSQAIPGDDVVCHSNGVDSLNAAAFLNALLKQIARDGNLLKKPDLPEEDISFYLRMKGFIGVPEASHDYAVFRKILRQSAKGQTALGMIIDANPVHTAPRSLKTAEALAKTGFLACFSSFLNDTTRFADVVIPAAHFLESWSAQIGDYPVGLPVLSTIQPVVKPAVGVIQTGDALIQAASKAGIKLDVKNQEEVVKSLVKRFRPEMYSIPRKLDANGVWEYCLRNGGWWPEPDKSKLSPRYVPPVQMPAVEKIKIANPKYAGGKDYGFNLHLYKTVNMGYGEAVNLPWLLEMPEPMTTLSWDSWVEINPKTAVKLGIDNGDVLKIESPFGSVEAPAFIYPGIAPNTVAMPFGWGHESFGRHASGRGANPMALLGDFPAENSDEPAWRAVKVKIGKTGKKRKMVREGNPEGEYEAEVFQL